MNPGRSRRLLLMVTGSIALFKLAGLVSRLREDGFEIQVVSTSAARDFVGAATWEGLTGRPPCFALYEPGSAMHHIDLARWADILLIAPATAHTINRLAAGLADDLIGALFLAAGRTRPVLLAPAMNQEMYRHPATQDSLVRLRSWGVKVLEPERGRLACGEYGEGKLMSPERLYENIWRTARELDLVAGLKRPAVLITGGATREQLDEVRVLTNTSTGRTASALADSFFRAGWQVCSLLGQGAEGPTTPVETSRFTDSADLAQQLKTTLSQSSFTAVVQAAAVSDYRIAEVRDAEGSVFVTGKGKWPTTEQLCLTLAEQPKILSLLRSWSASPQTRVVGFKLTATPSLVERRAAVAKLFSGGSVDWVVHNDWGDWQQPGQDHAFTVYAPDFAAHSVASREDLGAYLAQLLRPPLATPTGKEVSL